MQRPLDNVDFMKIVMKLKLQLKLLVLSGNVLQNKDNNKQEISAGANMQPIAVLSVVMQKTMYVSIKAPAR
jgi:hypothetical protein